MYDYAGNGGMYAYTSVEIPANQTVLFNGPYGGNGTVWTWTNNTGRELTIYYEGSSSGASGSYSQVWIDNQANSDKTFFVGYAGKSGSFALPAGSTIQVYNCVDATITLLLYYY